MSEGSDSGSAGAGKRLGDFRLLRVLASGSQGDVYEAEQISTGLHVALKILRPSLALDRKSLQRFQREAEAGEALAHANIVAVHAVGEHGGVHYIAQELVGNGRTLAHLIDDARNRAAVPATWYRDVALICAQVADALQAAHDGGLMHRDIKPRNILIAEDGVPRVADFGLARMLDEHELTSTGDVLGTPFYMSPEQVRAHPDQIDARTDIFSLGVVLYEALTLTRPFTGDTPQILDKIQRFDPPDPRRVHARAPRDLAVICMHAIEKRPERRYATARDFAADLRRFAAGQPIVARPPGLLMRTGKFLTVHRVAVLITSVVILATIAVSIAVVKQREEQAAKDVEERSGKDLTKVLESLFQGSDQATAGAEPVLAPRWLLDAGAQQVALIVQANPRWHLLMVLGRGYANLGLHTEAFRHFSTALDLARAEFGEHDERTVGAQLDMGRECRHLGDFGAAEQHDLVARRENVQRFGEGSWNVLVADCELGLLDRARLDYPSAERRLRDYLAGCQRLATSGLDEAEVLGARHALGMTLMEMGNLEEADQLLGEAYRRAPGLLSRLKFLELASSLADLRDIQGAAAATAGDLERAQQIDVEAESLYRTVLDGQRRLLGPREPETARTLANYAVFLRKRSRFDEARPMLEESLSIHLETRGPDDVGTLYVRNDLGVLEFKAGNAAEAEKQLLEVIAADRRGGQHDKTPVLTALQNLMRLTRKQGRLDDAERWARELVERTPGTDPNHDLRDAELKAIQQEVSAVPPK